MASFFHSPEGTTSVAGEQLRPRLDAKAFAGTAERLGVTYGDLAKCLGLSTRTVHRKLSTGGRLSLSESERVIRVHRIWNAARSLFERDEAIAAFLRAYEPSLGASPLESLNTDISANEVESFIIGLSHGNFQ